jgi:hypothetical protein
MGGGRWTAQLLGIASTAGLRIFHNYQKANDWVSELADRGAVMDSMDKSKWRTLIKSFGV